MDADFAIATFLPQQHTMPRAKLGAARGVMSKRLLRYVDGQRAKCSMTTCPSLRRFGVYLREVSAT